MNEQDNEFLSPTVTKVLDEYLIALRAEDDIDNEDANRLDTFLRTGKVPGPDDLEAALFPKVKGEAQ